MNIFPSQSNSWNPVTRRIVEIYVSDPDPSVPVDQVLLVRTDRLVTEETDGELVLQLDIPGKLAKWNETRVTIRDKRFPESDVKLEPAKFRDLRFTFVTVATL